MLSHDRYIPLFRLPHFNYSILTAVCFLEQNVRILLFPLVLYSLFSNAGFALAWGCMSVFDILVFGMTMYRILTLHRSNNASMLTTVFMRDGERG